MIKTAYVRTEISKYIDKFEDNVDRIITMDEFIDELPNIYDILTQDTETPLGGMSKEDFLWIAGVGQHTSHIPKGMRKQFIDQMIAQRS